MRQAFVSTAVMVWIGAGCSADVASRDTGAPDLGAPAVDAGVVVAPDGGAADVPGAPGADAGVSDADGGAPEADGGAQGGDAGAACRFAPDGGPPMAVFGSCGRNARIGFERTGMARIERATPLTVRFDEGSSVRVDTPYAVAIAEGARVWAAVRSGGPLQAFTELALREGGERGRLLAAVWFSAPGVAARFALPFTFEDDACGAVALPCGQGISKSLVATLGGQQVRVASGAEVHAGGYRVVNAHAHRYLAQPRCSETGMELAVGAIVADDLTVAPTLPPAASATVAAPADRFRQITAGGPHACGLRQDGTVTCWWNGEAPIGYPQIAGTFEEVAAGGHDTCMRNAAGAASCVSAAADPGPFVQIAAGRDVVCGLLAGGALRCWGSGAPAPGGSGFTRVRSGRNLTCALSAGGADCWPNTAGRSVPARGASGALTDVAIGETRVCALRDDATLACWNASQDVCNSAPAGTFTALAMSRDILCALRGDGTLLCEGPGATTPPAGSYTALAASDDIACALDAQGLATCWSPR